MKIPENLSMWDHIKTGNTYRVLTIANLSATKSGWTVTTVYEDTKGNVWSRPLTEWLEKYRQL